MKPFLLTLLICASTLRADPIADLKKVGIDQHLGKTVPLDLRFRDESGSTITLRDCVHGRPVLLNMVYFKCPMLCTVSLNQLGRSLNVLSESVGKDFDIITVSFNPREDAHLARAKKLAYMRAYRREGAESGWHFLTGDQDSIDALANAIGFRYTWDAQSQQFIHASTVVVLASDGTITRYFLGVDYPPNELREAMNEAKTKSISKPAESVFLYCINYDPTTGKYGLIISRAIRAFSLLTLACLTGLILFFVRRERRLARN